MCIRDSLDVFFCTGTVHDSRIVFRNSYLVGSTQHFDSSLFQFQAFFFADYNTACQYGNVFQHFLATVAEARSLHCTCLLYTSTGVASTAGKFAACFALGARILKEFYPESVSYTHLDVYKRQVYLEIEGTTVADVSLELLTKGRKLANQLGCQLEAVAAGSNLAGIEKQVLPFGVDKLQVLEAPGLFP